MLEASRPALMIDLETVGTRSDAPILQVAAVSFDLDAQGDGLGGPEFFRNVLLEDAGQGPIDAATLLWWLQQDPAARTRVFSETGGEGSPRRRIGLRQSLVELAAFVRTTFPEKVPDVWACAPTFDLAMLRNAGRRNEVQALGELFGFRNERCFRTLRKLGDDLGIKGPPGGVEHDALADARSQARHAVTILRTLRLSKVGAR